MDEGGPWLRPPLSSAIFNWPRTFLALSLLFDELALSAIFSGSLFSNSFSCVNKVKKSILDFHTSVLYCIVILFCLFYIIHWQNKTLKIILTKDCITLRSLIQSSLSVRLSVVLMISVAITFINQAQKE